MRAFLAPVLLVVLGAAVAVAVPGVAGTAIAIVLVGTGCVVGGLPPVLAGRPQRGRGAGAPAW